VATLKQGKGSGNFLQQFVALLCTVRDQSQRSILSHEPCYHNFDRKLRGVNQLGNHKLLLCQSSQTNYAALALGQCE